jgi:hypothetical protein
MERLLRFDFGNDFVPHDPGFIKIERLYQTPAFLWVCEMRNRWFSETECSPWRDCLYGREGEFRMGLPAGEYCLKLYCYDPVQEPEPFEVWFGSTDAYAPRLQGTYTEKSRVNPRKGEKFCLSAKVKHTGGILAVSFPGEYFVNGLDVYGPAGTVPFPVYEEGIPDKLPVRQEVEQQGSDDCRAMLEQICEWLLKVRRSDGFIGDFEEGKRLWYTASYPVRTLLAGYALLHRSMYRDAVFGMLDRFVSEQMPEGGFTQSCRGTPTALLTEEELEKVRRSNWMNLADVGSMVAALAAACHYAEGERRGCYEAAVRKYLDQWAMRFRSREGGFTNGWTLAMDDKVYSVATASTGLACVLFYTVTGEDHYLAVAEEAALYLAENWNPDGRLWNHIYKGTYPGHDHYQDVREFGDGFYTLETIAAVLTVSTRAEAGEKLFSVLEAYLFGEKGLFALKGEEAWWPLENCWHNSKSAGNPVLLDVYLRFWERFGKNVLYRDQAAGELSLCRKFLATPRFAYLLGVMCDEPDKTYPFAKHSIQCWNGCAAAATGFAGIAMAQMLSPGLIFGQGQRTFLVDGFPGNSDDEKIQA